LFINCALFAGSGAYLFLYVSSRAVYKGIYAKNVRHDYSTSCAVGTCNKANDNGVPQIYAQNEEDAWFALGYLMAQERLFQMDLYRRLSQGRLSELLGPFAVKYDVILRTLRLKKYAEEMLSKNSDILNPLKKSFDAFLAGLTLLLSKKPMRLNFYIGYKPELFTHVV
jgi:penicillin amidase